MGLLLKLLACAHKQEVVREACMASIDLRSADALLQLRSDSRQRCSSKPPLCLTEIKHGSCVAWMRVATLLLGSHAEGALKARS